MAGMIDLLHKALNAHDAAEMASLFAEDYRSIQPLHPSRAFTGRAQVLKNWSAVFADVPDLIAVVVASSVAGDTEWAEWDWRGHHADGSVFMTRGVTIMVIRNGLIAEMRLYLEAVEVGGRDIDAFVQETYHPSTE